MAFITSNGLTESTTGKTVEAGGMNVHYHDIGTGGAGTLSALLWSGTTAWITFHKVWPRCPSTSGAS